MFSSSATLLPLLLGGPLLPSWAQAPIGDGCFGLSPQLHSIEMLERIDALAGITPWILKDFRSPRRFIPGIQDDFNRKGLLSEKGERKHHTLLERHPESIPDSDPGLTQDFP